MDMQPGKLGVAIEDRYLRHLMAQAMSGNITMTISPETVAPEPTSDAWTRTVTITFTNSDDEVHKWLTGSIASAVSIANTSSAGTASIESTTLTLTEGVGTVVVSGDAASWANAETDTLSVDLDICGFNKTGTSVETFTT